MEAQLEPGNKKYVHDSWHQCTIRRHSLNDEEISRYFDMDKDFFSVDPMSISGDAHDIFITAPVLY